jgi:hypothetical protein
MYCLVLESVSYCEYNFSYINHEVTVLQSQ